LPCGTEITDAAGLTSRADLVNKKRKRLSDTDRKEDLPFDNATDDQTVTGRSSMSSRAS
jgi:hypothetical protein